MALQYVKKEKMSNTNHNVMYVYHFTLCIFKMEVLLHAFKEIAMAKNVHDCCYVILKDNKGNIRHFNINSTFITRVVDEISATISMSYFLIECDTLMTNLVDEFSAPSFTSYFFFERWNCIALYF